jgi:hypothetical protein
MMLVMMPMMMRGHGSSCHNSSEQSETKPLQQPLEKLEQKEQ